MNLIDINLQVPKNEKFVINEFPLRSWQSPNQHSFELKDNVHIWLIELSQIPQAQINYLKTILSVSEKEKAGRYRFIADQNRHILGRAALRYLIKSYLKTPLAAIQIENGENDKPYLVAPSQELSFNISHSADKILLAIDLKKELVGIDVERVDQQYGFESVIKDYFTTEEQAYILEKDCRTRFFQLWTRKEAIVKAVGTGLTDDLNIINVLNNYTITDSKEFLMHSFRIDEEYLGAIALDNDNNNFSFWNAKNILLNIR